METKIVMIPSKDEHEGIHTMCVTLPWVCPVCGEPRGEIHRVRSYDGSRWMLVDGWTNPCGHVDKYSKVREEYKRLQGDEQ